MKALRTGFALTLVTAVCSLGLVLQTAQPAAALVSPIDLGKVAKTAKPVAVGAGKGVSLFGRGTPAGWVLTAGQLAWWGYSERDSISDFLQKDGPKDLEQWCNVNPGCVPPTGGASTTQWADTKTKAVLSVTNDFQVQLGITALSCNNGCTNFSNQWTTAGTVGTTADQATKGVSCRRPDGTEYLRNFSNVAGQTPVATPLALFVGATGSGGSMTGTILFQCASSNDKLIGLKVLPVTNPGPAGQSYKVEWGRPIPAFPEGEVTFDEVIVTARCKNTVTGETTTIKATSDYGPSGTIVMPSCKEHLGDDWYGTGFTIAPVKPKIDGEPIPDEEWDVPDFLPKEWDEEIPDEGDPDWQPCFGTKKGCSLSVWLDGNPVTTTTKVDVKTLEEIVSKDPTRMKCYYGANVVDLKNCYALITEIINAQAGLDTTLEPGTGTGTDTGTGTGTESPPKPTVEEAQQKSECFPHGWGVFNPFEWIYKPVKCALVWAFVPDGDFGLEALLETLRTRPPGSLIIGAGQVAQSALSGFTGGGCGTLGTIPLPGPDLTLSCPQITSMSGYGLVYSGFEALIYGSGIFAVFRMITGAFRKGSDT